MKTPQIPSRTLIEMTILKALVWKPGFRENILTSFMPDDFSPDSKKIFSALANMVDIGIDIRQNTLETALESPVPVQLFDAPPNEKDITIAIELFKQKISNKKKAMEKIHGWKKTIDNLTLLVENGKVEPRQWVEQVQTIIPSPKIESSVSGNEMKELAKRESLLIAKESEILLREKELETKEYNIRALEGTETKKLSELSSKESHLEQQQQELEAQKREIETLLAELKRSENNVKNRETEISALENTFAERETILAEKELALARLEVHNDQMEREFELKEQQLGEQEAKLDEKSRELTERESKLLQQEKTVESFSLKKNKLWDRLYQKYRTSELKGMTGLDPGFPEFTGRFGGLRGTTMIYGPAKTGKTALALQLAFGVVMHSNSFLMYYTADSIPESIYFRILSRVSGIAYEKFVKNSLEQLDRKEMENLSRSMKKLEQLNDRINVIGNHLIPMNTEFFKNQIKEFTQKNPQQRGLIVIDSLDSFSNYIYYDGSGQETRTIQCLNILREIEAEYGVTVLTITGGGDELREQSRQHTLKNLVDNFIEIIPKNHGYTGEENFSNKIRENEELDLMFTCRDADNLYLPMLLSRDCLKFSVRKKGFKARKIDWDQQEKQPQGQQLPEEAPKLQQKAKPAAPVKEPAAPQPPPIKNPSVKRKTNVDIEEELPRSPLGPVKQQELSTPKLQEPKDPKNMAKKVIPKREAPILPELPPEPAEFADNSFMTTNSLDPEMDL